MRKLCFLVFASWFTFLAIQAAEFSLAIVPEDDMARQAADLLTAQLSAEPNLRLLERAQLQRIVTEQSLSLANSQDLLRVGRLAGANALLFIDHFSQQKEEGHPPEQHLGLRLIAVGPGVVIHTVDYPWPAPDTTEWSSTTARTLRPHLARVQIPESSATKLSLLNLRSATDSRESRLLDRELNALLLKRLARESNMFVLERQKLGATLLERELNAETAPFWRGSYLIDGTVNKLGFSTNAIAIEARIVSPGGKATNIINLAGKRSELPGVIERFMIQVLKLADQGSTGSWDVAAEARRFFEEAAWSLRWKLWPEAQAAADAAWALGKQDEATALLRVQAYGRATEADTGPIHTFAQRRRKYFEKPPRPESLSSGISALSIFLEWSARVPVEKASKEWLSSGLEALQNSSMVLHHYYFTPEARQGVEEDLAELRGLCRDSAAWMALVPSIRAPFFLEGPELSFDEITSAFEGEHLFKTMAVHGAIWQERMADALPLHRMLITAPSFGFLRGMYLGEDWFHLPVAGWKWDDRKNAVPTWQKFLGELEKSTNVVTRIEANFLQSMEMTSDEKLNSKIREILRLVASNQAALERHPSPLQYEYRLNNLVNRGSNLETPERNALIEEIRLAQEIVFKSILDGQVLNVSIRNQHATAAKLFEGQKRFLQELRTDPREFNEFFPPFGVFPKAQAQTILSMLQDYRTALTNLLQQAEIRVQGEIHLALNQTIPLESRLNAMLGIPNRKTPSASKPASTPPPLRSGPSRPVGPVAKQDPFVPTPVRTNRLLIESFHSISSNTVAMSKVIELQNTSFARDGSKVWLRTEWVEWRSGPGYTQQSQQGLITLFDPVRGVQEMIPTGFEPQLSFFPPLTPMIPNFVIWNGDIFAAGGTQLRRYDRGTRQWREMLVPLSDDAKLYLLDGRLLVLNSESLLEVSANGAEVKTLASARRNPPITPLDAVTNLSAGSLFASTEGFRVWAPPSLYQFRNGSFSVLDSFKPPGQVSGDPGRFLYVEQANRPERNLAYSMAPRAEKVVSFFKQLPSWSYPLDYKPPTPTDQAVNTVWAGLDQYSFDIESAVFDGDDILIWGNPVGHAFLPSAMSPAAAQSHLILLSKRFKEPVVFLPEMAPGTPFLWKRPKLGNLQPRLFTTTTKDHLVLGNQNQPGLWFVPLAEIAKQAEAAKLVEAPGRAE